jgi:hypothetical protein
MVVQTFASHFRAVSHALDVPYFHQDGQTAQPKSALALSAAAVSTFSLPLIEISHTY